MSRRLSDSDAHEVIHLLRQGEPLTEATLRAFADWADEQHERLTWLIEHAVCKCGGKFTSTGVCQPCVYGRAA